MRIAGIDGCKGGWVVVHADEDDLSSAEVCFVSDLKQALNALKLSFAVVDIPIGFTSGPDDRDVEAAMRKSLPGKASSVFNTPCRQALYAEDYKAASEVNRQIIGKGLSKQTHAIFPKMREMDMLVRDVGQILIREGHPEVTFAKLNNDAPIPMSKKDSAGQSQRMEVLRANSINTEELYQTKRKLGAAIDDVLDAAALLVTARRYCRNEHITIPPIPSRDAEGLEMSVIA